MAQTTFVNKLGIIHRGSGGVQESGFKDTCWTTIGDNVVPIPYNNIAYATDIVDGPTTVTTDGEMPLVKDAKISKSIGDENGDKKGVVSGTILDIAEPISYSFDVTFEGKNVCHLSSTFFHNKKNTSGSDRGEKSHSGAGSSGSAVDDKSKAQQSCGGDPIDLVTGDVIKNETDVLLTGPLKFSIARYYNSDNSSRKGLLGFGWSTVLDSFARIVYGNLEYSDSHGEVLTMVLDPSENECYYSFRKIHILWDEASIRIRDNQGITQVFDIRTPEANGRLSEVNDLNGNRITFLYDNHRLTEIVDSNRRSFSIRYKQQGLISQFRFMSPSTGRETLLREYFYDNGSRLVAVNDESGYPWHYEYDAGNRMVKAIKRNNYAYHYLYDDEGRCIKGWGEDGALTVELHHFPEKRRTEVLDCAGNKTTYYYDYKKMITMVVDPMGNNSQFYYDTNGNIIGVVNKDKTTRVMQYDPQGNLTQVRDEEGHVQSASFSRDAFSSHDALNRGTWGDYDDRHNLIRVIDALGNQEEYGYNHRGELTGITTRGGRTILIHRPDHHHMEIESPDGTRTSLELDDWGRVLSKQDPLGNVARIRYDLRGQPTAITDKNGGTTILEYDPEGNVVLFKEPMGNETRFVYNGLGRLIKQTDGNGHSIEFIYNPNQTLAEIINENNENHTFEYDVLRRVILEKGFDGRTTSYDYDQRGNITRTHRPDSTVMHGTYDKKGRLVRIHGTGSDGISHQVRYTYDPAGNLILAENDHSRISFVYNELNQLVREEQGDNVIESEFDADNTLLAIKTSWGSTTRFERDANAGLTGIVLPNGQSISYLLDPLGRITSATMADRILCFNSIDPAGAITAQRLFVDDREMGSRRFIRNANGQVVKSGDYDGSRINIFDKAGRLTEVAHIDTGLSEQFDLDPAGNLLLKDNMHRATYAPGNLLSSIGNTLYKNDLNGNRIEKNDPTATTHYRYNLLHQLSEVICSDGTSCSYSYDALGRRILKSVSGKDTKTRYYWFGYKLLAEEALPLPFDSQPKIESSAISPYIEGPREIIDYVHLPNRHIPVAQVINDDAYFYWTDYLGTPLEMVDDTGKVVWSGKYSALGECSVDGRSEIENNIRFQGQYFDVETHLHFNMFRYYDPDTGRYITKDPIAYQSGDLNLYRYVHNTPTNRIDSLGLDGYDVSSSYKAFHNGAQPIRDFMQFHYNRNQFNKQHSYQNAKDCGNDEVSNLYHQQGLGNEGNQKFVFSDGSENIFDTNNNPVLDVVNGPTFNLSSPVDAPIGHFLQDMVPYYIWGNVPTDPTNFVERILGSYAGPIPSN